MKNSYYKFMTILPSERLYIGWMEVLHLDRIYKIFINICRLFGRSDNILCDSMQSYVLVISVVWLMLWTKNAD